MKRFDNMEIDGKIVSVCQNGEGGPIVLFCNAVHPAHDIRHLAELTANASGADFILAAFEAADWNAEYSPWEAPAAFGSENFTGKGKETLECIVERVLPELRKRFPAAEKIYIAGYSLAGLFSLWALYESDVFDGAASCSGSLWFPGWDKYMETASLKKNCSVYLSLGAKEEKTRNAMMSTVGDRTRTQSEILQSDALVSNSILQMNPGGHFNQVEERIAAGIAWLIT